MYPAYIGKHGNVVSLVLRICSRLCRFYYRANGISVRKRRFNLSIPCIRVCVSTHAHVYKCTHAYTCTYVYTCVQIIQQK